MEYLTIKEHVLYDYIKQFGTIDFRTHSVIKISEDINMDRGNVYKVINRLVKKGYITREDKVLKVV